MCGDFIEALSLGEGKGEGEGQGEGQGEGEREEKAMEAMAVLCDKDVKEYPEVIPALSECDVTWKLRHTSMPEPRFIKG